MVVADAPDLSLEDMVGLAVQPASLLLPVIGILLVCSEWSQRTAMITFTLVPARSRVMVAKLLAALLLAIVAFQVAFAFAAVGTALGGGSWRYSAGLVGQVAVYTIVPMLAGVAFGAALRNPAGAIVGYFLIPIAFAALVSIPAIDGIAPVGRPDAHDRADARARHDRAGVGALRHLGGALARRPAGDRLVAGGARRRAVSRGGG